MADDHKNFASLRSKIEFFGRRCRRFFHRLLFSVSELKKISACDALFLCHDADRSIDAGGVAYAPIIDSLIDSFKAKSLRCATIAAYGSKATGPLAHNNPICLERDFFKIFHWQNFRRLFFLHQSDPSLLGRKLWRLVLERAKPKFFITIDGTAALYRSCREAGVTVYEVQHGVISADHPTFGKKFRKGSDLNSLPHGYLTWDEGSAQTIREWADEKGLIVKIIGHPFFGRFSEGAASDDPMIGKLRTAFPGKVSEKPNILVSLQWGIEDIYRHGEVEHECGFPLALREVVQMTGNKFNWHFRLHPVQRRGYEGALVENLLNKWFSGMEHVEWRRASSIPLPLQLVDMDAHITLNSTITQEAGWFGIKTALLCPLLREGERLASYFAHERALGLATCIDSATVPLLEWLGTVDKRPRHQNSEVSAMRRKFMAFIEESSIR